MAAPRGHRQHTRALKNTDGGYLPFWSPDSRSIGFAASGQLKRLDLENDSVRKLANAPLFLGGTWGRDGRHHVRAEHDVACVPYCGERPGKSHRGHADDRPRQPVDPALPARDRALSLS